MTQHAAMKQLFNLMKEEYDIKSASDVKATLLNMFGSFMNKFLKQNLLNILDIADISFLINLHLIQEIVVNLRLFKQD